MHEIYEGNSRQHDARRVNTGIFEACSAGGRFNRSEIDGIDNAPGFERLVTIEAACFRLINQENLPITDRDEARDHVNVKPFLAMRCGSLTNSLFRSAPSNPTRDARARAHVCA